MTALRAPRLGRGGRSQADHAVGRDGFEQALERQRADFLALDEVLECCRDARGDEYLPALGLAAEPRGQVGDRPDSAVVPTPFEADRADRRVALRDPDAQGEVVTPLAPSRAQVAETLAHGD